MVEQAMGQDMPDAVLIMIKALGYSRETAKAILRLRAGKRGISPGEIDQCLATLSRLPIGIARQIIKFRDNPTLALGARFTRAAAG
jgi:hypothetical protein